MPHQANKRKDVHDADAAVTAASDITFLNRTTNQSINNTTDTLISFDGAITEHVFTAAAHVVVSCWVGMAVNATGARSLVILFTPSGGAAKAVAGDTSDSIATFGWCGSVTAELIVANGDKVQFQVWQSSGVAFNINPAQASVVVHKYL